MLFFFLRNLAKYSCLLVLASIVIFVCLEVLPGNAAQLILGVNASADAVRELEQQLGINQPVLLRYLHWISGFVTLDWGNSYIYQTPVMPLILERFAITLPLTILALVLACIMSFAIATICCLTSGSKLDYVLMWLTQVGIAIPSFWLAFLLILVFSVWLKWLPSGGFAGWSTDIWGSLRALILPAASLTLVLTSILARNMRANLLNLSETAFVKTARAKGLSESYILWHHILPHTSTSMLTLIGLQFATLLTGAIVVEQVFFLPGVGQLLLTAINNRDLVLLRSGLFFLVGLILVINLVIDYCQKLLDPRLAR